MKKKKDGFAREDGEIAGREREKLGEKAVTKKKSKKERIDGKKKRKKKQKCGKSDRDVTTPSSKSTKRVKFSDQVDIFSAEDEDTEDEEVAVVRGKRFTKSENELVKNVVLGYIDNHALGDEGLRMVLECKSHPQLKGCWKEIASALPWRPHESVYCRAHTLFEAGSRGIWMKEDLERVIEFQKKHGNDWRKLADEMGKHRKHVKDAWKRTRLASKNKGHWTREEYQSLFDLVN